MDSMCVRGGRGWGWVLIEVTVSYTPLQIQYGS